jgi:hypothetical protein
MAGVRRGEQLEHSSHPFAHQRKSKLMAVRQKKKTLCAPREPQKVLVVELVLLNPMGRMLLRGTPC